MPGTEIILKQQIVAVARSYYFETSSNPTFALSPPTPKGAGIFAQCILDRVFAQDVIRCAMAAASGCDVQPVHPKSPLQERLANVLRDSFPLGRRPHPLNHDQAKAFAEVIVAGITPEVEGQAFDTAARRQHMTGSELLEEAAREREAEIERNRRRPPRKPLYPV
jgi:hypothetical protein